MTVLVVAGWVCFLGLAIFLLALWWFERRERRLREHRKVEISELAMIFQTLRDVVSEQKILAKEFNENVEEKIGVVKKIVNEAKNKLVEIEEAITKCNRRVQEVEEEIELVLSRMGRLKELLSERESEIYRTINETENVLVEVKERLKSDVEERKAEESNINVKSEFFEMKSNSGSVKPDHEESSECGPINEEEVVEKEGQISEEMKSLKSAYSSILGVDGERIDAEAKKVELESEDDGERKVDLTPVQKIVLEYHKSGMTTSEIAKELGITKGEVRLILSLALAKIDKGNND